MLLRQNTDGFPPFCGPEPRALLLGSYPSPKSFAAGFYYGNPHNRFWPLLAGWAAAEIPRTRAAQEQLLARCHLAVWDSLKSCTIEGAQDATIRDAVPNDIAGLLRRLGPLPIFCNGAAAHRFYTRFCQPHTGCAANALPSTSPANASYSLERLSASWQPLRIALGL